MLRNNCNRHKCQELVVDRPWLTLLIYQLVTALLYLQASRFPVFSPVVVQPSSIDESLPFFPPLAYIYISYFLLFPVLVFFGFKREGFANLYVTGIVCGLLNLAIYILFPTMLSGRIDAADSTLLSFIQAQDTILCALPSGHVSLPVSIAVAAYLIERETKPATTWSWMLISYGYAIWAAAIAISALLIGQHYVVDIIGGVIFGGAVACAVYLISNVYRRTLSALFREWLIIIAVITIALYLDRISLYIVAGFILSTRQHALLILFHDAVHGLVAKNKRLNDLVINAMVGVPLLIPVHIYRAIHISHHKHIGTPKDPERLLLYWGQPWNYTPLHTRGLLVQLLGDVSGFNSLISLSRYVKVGMTERKFEQYKTPIYLESLLIFAAFFLAIMASYYVWPHKTTNILLLWFLSYLTFTQLLQKIRSFTEHTLQEKNDYTNNWHPGMLGQLVIWPYNINYHREHHADTNVPWDQLPTCSNLDDQRLGRDLIPHIWKGLDL